MGRKICVFFYVTESVNDLYGLADDPCIPPDIPPSA